MASRPMLSNASLPTTAANGCCSVPFALYFRGVHLMAIEGGMTMDEALGTIMILEDHAVNVNAVLLAVEPAALRGFCMQCNGMAN